MDRKYVLGIDCGTTHAKVMILDRNATQAGFARSGLATLKHGDGCSEQDPEVMWGTIHELIREAMSEKGVLPGQIAAMGIANQRETTIVWDRHTGIPYANAILWNDKRAVSLAAEAASGKMGPRVAGRVGMPTIPNTSAMLLSWLLQNEPRVIEGVRKGDALFGTVNSWLLWKLTGGKAHCSDHANMSVTQLQNAAKLDYDGEVLAHLQIPRRILPALKSTGEIYGTTDRKLFSGAHVPIAGMLGDQMAAALGQGCIEKGMVKVTYGTGCFCVMNSGSEYTPPSGGLYSPVLWGDRKNPTYCLEGFFEVNEDRTDKSVLEGIAYRTADIVKAMESITGYYANILRVDGGMSQNDYLLQFLADILGIPIERPAVSEATAIGANYQAGLTLGFWRSLGETAELWKLGKRFEPEILESERKQLISGWLNSKNIKVQEGERHG
jgi:glycerol kinase